MRQEGLVEGALQPHASWRNDKKHPNKPSTCGRAANKFHNKWKNRKKAFPPCKQCGKKEHPPFKCWTRQNAKSNKCGELGHEVIICTSQPQTIEAHIANEDEEDAIFIAQCHAVNCRSETWLIDSGCRNHMAYDRSLLKELSPCVVTKVKIGDGWFLMVKGKQNEAISTNYGTSVITEVLFVPYID